MLFINRSAPYGSAQARESLDALLAAAAFEQEVKVLFMADGVFQLLKEQQSDAIQQKNMASMLSVLEMYDVDEIYVQEQALSERGLKAEQLAIQVTGLNNTEISHLMADQDTLLSF